MAWWKRLLGDRGSQEPSREEPLPLYQRSMPPPAPAAPVPSPPPVALVTVAPKPVSVSTLSAADQQRFEDFEQALGTEMGGASHMPEAFVSHLTITCKGLKGDAFKRAVLSHPDFAEVHDQALFALAFETKPDTVKNYIRFKYASGLAEGLYRQLEEQPNKPLSFDDHRPLSAFGKGINLRWRCRYQRAAGALSDQERLLYAVATAALEYKAINRDEASEWIVSALWGDGHGRADWELDPEYGGDNAQKLYEAAQEHYGPVPVQQSYRELVTLIMAVADKQPDHELAQFALPLIQGGGNQWATSR